MGYTIDEWENRKKKISPQIIEEIYSRVCSESKKDRQQWDEFVKESTFCAIDDEVEAYQYIIIFDLMNKYDIHCPSDVLNDVIYNMITSLSYDITTAKSQMKITPYFELANLVSFLQEAKNNNSGLTIKTNKGSSNIPIKIEDETILSDLHGYCDALLYSHRNHEYKTNFGWKDKRLFRQILLPILPCTFKESNFININELILGTKSFDKPYSYEELKEIISFEKIKRGTVRNFDKNYRHKMITETIDDLREYNVFSTELETISTKEACFLYDVLMVLETIPYNEISTPQDKYQYIKRHIKK